MKKTILIITDSTDLHADWVEQEIIKRCHPVFRLNLDCFPKYYSVNQFLSGEITQLVITHQPTHYSLSFDEVGSIWTRKKSSFKFKSTDFSAQEYAFAQQETKHALFAFLMSIDGFWMNHPNAVNSSFYKGEQSLRAKNLGFSIPDSLISNQPNAVIQLYNEVAGKMITKALSSGYLAADQVSHDEIVVAGLETTMVTPEHMEAVECVSEFPTYFQAYVEKDTELRVTVVDDRVFTAQIHSQQDARTQIDYRNFAADITYSAFNLPDEIERRCLKLVHSYGLNYGAIDLILTPTGDYVFLENNPGGQYLFIEELVPELNITQYVVDTLIRKCQ